MAATNVLHPENEKLRRWAAEAVRLYFEPVRWLLAPFRRNADSEGARPSPAPSADRNDLAKVGARHFVMGTRFPAVRRTLNVSGRITSDPQVRSGKPVIRGTRITVRDVVEYLAGGMTAEEILQDFPQLTAEDIRAAVTYAENQGHVP